MRRPTVVHCDKAVNWQVGFQDPATPIAEGIIRFHHDRMIILTGVVVFVGGMMFRAWVLYSEWSLGKGRGVVHGSVLEIVGTRIPAGRLLRIAGPSVVLLYSMEEQIDPAMTRKVIGHQGYGSYEYSDVLTPYGEVREYDSYMIPDSELKATELRLLAVDKKVYLPSHTQIRLIVTSGDVLHCGTVPSFGVKIDACPGRLNQVRRYPSRPGVFYGQCSEICGVNHGFMPICVEVMEANSGASLLTKMSEDVGPGPLEQEIETREGVMSTKRVSKKDRFPGLGHHSYMRWKLHAWWYGWE